MEAFLLGLDALIEEQSDLTIIDLLGALQFTQQRLAVEMLLNDDEEDDEA
jgi:sulfur carrier protein ThiS